MWTTLVLGDRAGRDGLDRASLRNGEPFVLPRSWRTPGPRQSRRVRLSSWANRFERVHRHRRRHLANRVQRRRQHSDRRRRPDGQRVDLRRFDLRRRSRHGLFDRCVSGHGGARLRRDRPGLRRRSSRNVDPGHGGRRLRRSLLRRLSLLPLAKRCSSMSCQSVGSMPLRLVA